MRGNTILSVMICMTLILGTTVISSAADKVGYINLQRLVNESSMGKAAREDIQKIRNDREAELRAKLKEVNDLKNFVNNEGANIDPAVKRDKIQELNKAYKEYQRLVTDARDEIANEDRELVAIILQKADAVLKEVAKKEKYTIILKDPNAIGYLDPSVDITDNVLGELNKKGGQ